jgi:excinuclease ABC subunit C
MTETAAEDRIRFNPGELQQTWPEEPGVYEFKDASGSIIYVGKAKNLKKRILSYCKPPQELPYKTALMMNKARTVDYIITSTEKEAYFLERSLIKKYMPRYNVDLRDDKQYPCLRLDINEPYPRLRIARRIRRDGALYFGPFSSARAVRKTLQVIDRVFQLRKCKRKSLPNRSRPCLNYQMDRCLGPCTNDIPASDYQAVMEQVRLFLEGRNRELLHTMNAQMQKAAAAWDFECAGRLRDQIRAVERTVEHQKVVSPGMEDRDIIGLSRNSESWQIVVLFVRQGCLVGSRNYRFADVAGSDSEIMGGFLKQYYPGEAFTPPEILVSEPLEDIRSLTDWLSELAGGKVVIRHPLRGEKRRWVEMAVANARNLLQSRAVAQGEDLSTRIQSVLKLKKPPRTIEALDISNLQGGAAVGVSVSFFDGRPRRAGYRNYKIRDVQGFDDYGMIAEVAARRLAKGNPPDLLLVDGGKGHLAAVQRALEVSRPESSRRIPGSLPEILAIAKADEGRREKQDKIYVPGRKNPLVLKPDHPVLLLMMRIRDEAHRRAIAYHRRLREKQLKNSRLDQIPGIGPKRKKILLEHFSDVQAISQAEAEKLSDIPGISRSLSEKIVEFLRS